jgi:Flp pilus assembly protein TadD
MAPMVTTVATALLHYQRGQLPEAEAICAQALQEDPQNAEALHLLGVIAHRQGQDARAIERLRQAAAADPSQAEIHYNLGTVYQFNGRLDEAVNCFQESLKLAPDSAEACSNLGYALTALGRAGEAVEHLRRAVAVKPTFAEAHNNLGLALKELEEYEEAIASFRTAVQLRPDYPEAQGNLGSTLFRQGDVEGAEEAWSHVVRLQPNNAFARSNLGWACKENGRLEKAHAQLLEATRLNPVHAEAHNNLGVVLTELGQFSEAKASLSEAIRLRTDYVDAINNLGLVYALEERVEDALAQYERSLSLAPDNIAAHFNRAMALLQAGEYGPAWPEYEWRWKMPHFQEATFPRPKWDGSPLAGRRILLFSEQGLGDTLQFIRYTSSIKQQGATVTVACQKALMPLLKRCPGIDRLLPTGSPWPDCDVHSSLMSLPGIFRTTLETIPSDVPYLHPDPALVERWRAELACIPGFRVGIGWQGNPKYITDRRRSIPLSAFQPLDAVSGVRLISLQKGPGSEQLTSLADRMAVLDLARRLDETSGAFMDTAAVMKNLDLVITSDTSLAHLAGGLGVPVWVALHVGADWRFLMKREDSPWYPTMRLFRQKQWGDWDEVFQRIARELRGLVAQTTPATDSCRPEIIRSTEPTPSSLEPEALPRRPKSVAPIELTFFPQRRHAVMTVSHERSGTHFLMNALAACYGYISAPWFNLDPNEPVLEVRTFGPNYYCPKSLRNELLMLAERRMANVVKSHHPVGFFENELGPLTDGYVIFVICRDPVTVMSSCWRFMHPWPWNTGPRAPDPLTFARAEPSGWLLRYQLQQHPSMLHRWADHVDGWVRAAQASPRIVLVRYEDLLSRYEETMRGFEPVLGRPPQAIVRPPRDVNIIFGGPDDPTGLGVAPDLEALRRHCRDTVGETMRRLGY